MPKLTACKVDVARNARASKKWVDRAPYAFSAKMESRMKNKPKLTIFAALRDVLISLQLRRPATAFTAFTKIKKSFLRTEIYKSCPNTSNLIGFRWPDGNKLFTTSY